MKRPIPGCTVRLAQLATAVEPGRSGAPDRLRELLTMRDIEVGRSRLTTFMPEDVPATNDARTRDLLDELDCRSD